jgi:hypothetical protein
MKKHLKRQRKHLFTVKVGRNQFSTLVAVRTPSKTVTIPVTMQDAQDGVRGEAGTCMYNVAVQRNHQLFPHPVGRINPVYGGHEVHAEINKTRAFIASKYNAKTGQVTEVYEYAIPVSAQRNTSCTPCGG